MFQVGNVPWNKGKPNPKVSVALKGHKVSAATRLKMSLARRQNPTRYWSGRTRPLDTRRKLGRKRDQHWHWQPDRSKLLARRLVENPHRYMEWSKNVKNRDNWRCRIADQDCNGPLEAHHILPWRAYPNSRYSLDNGITLCRFHHPRKHTDEVRLSPLFQRLVAGTLQLTA